MSDQKKPRMQAVADGARQSSQSIGAALSVIVSWAIQQYFGPDVVPTAVVGAVTYLVGVWATNIHKG